MMINTALNLSKLSRGKGERRGSYIEVIYDDQVRACFFIILGLSGLITLLLLVNIL